MDCFILFERHEKGVFFEAEYCLQNAVHTMRGIIEDKNKLCEVLGAKEEDLLRLLTVRFSANNDLFAFLKKNDIPFTVSEKSYADTSSDV